MKYLRGERIKLKSQKTFRALLFISLGAISLSIFSLSRRENPEANPYYREFLGELSGDYDRDYEAFKLIDDKLTQAGSFERSTRNNMPLEDRDQAYKAYQSFEKERKKDPNYLEAASYASYYLLEKIDYIRGVYKEIDFASQELKKRQISPIFSGSSYAKASLGKQSQAYKKLAGEDLVLSLDYEGGFDLLKDTFLLDAFLAIFVFLTGLLIFFPDRKYGMGSLIGSCKDGLRHSARGKISLLLLISLLGGVLVYGGLVLFAGLSRGFGDLSRSIQSVILFRDGEVNLSIRSFLVLYLLEKILALLFLAGLTSLILSLSKNLNMDFLIFFAYLGLSFIFYEKISSYSSRSLIKETSYFSLTDGFSLRGAYGDLGLGGLALNKKIFLPLFCLILLLLFAFISLKVMESEKIGRDQGNIKSFMGKFSFKSLMGGETFRLLIQGRGLPVSLLGVFFFALAIRGVGLPPDTGERMNYLINLADLQGPVSKTALSQMEELGKSFSGLDEEEEKLQEEYQEGKITSFEKSLGLSKLEGKRALLPSYEEIRDQMETSYKKTGGDVRLYLVDKRKGELYFEKNRVLALAAIVASSLMTILSQGPFINDKNNGMEGLIKSTKNGNKKLIKMRMLLFSTFALVLNLAFTLLLRAKARHLEADLDGGILVQSIPHLLNFDKIITFKTLFILLFAYRCLSLIGLGLLESFLAQKFDPVMGLFLGLILPIFPNFISIFTDYGKILGLIPLVNASLINQSLGILNFKGLVLELALSLVLVALLYRINVKTWTGKTL